MWIQFLTKTFPFTYHHFNVQFPIGPSLKLCHKPVGVSSGYLNRLLITLLPDPLISTIYLRIKRKPSCRMLKCSPASYAGLCHDSPVPSHDRGWGGDQSPLMDRGSLPYSPATCVLAHI